MNEIVSNAVFYVALLFIMMLPGIIMKKTNLCPEGFGKGLSNLVLYIAQPALVFLAYVRPYDKAVLINSLKVLLISSIIHGIFAVVATFAFKKVEDGHRRILRLATVFSNAAFMGIPLISAVFPTHPEATIYATVYNIAFNLFLWSLGVYFCTSRRDMDNDGDLDSNKERLLHVFSSLGKAFIHPVTIAAFVGIIFFIAPIENSIPKIIMDALDMLRVLVAPLSMFVIGIRLSDISFKGFFKDFYMFLFVFLRHFFLPFLTMLVILLLRLIGIGMNELLSTVIVIMSATPAASSVTMFAEKFDCDSLYASKTVAFSTVLTIVSIPLVVLLSSVIL